MTAPSVRPIEAYVHGLDGPLCLITGAEAVALLAYRNLAGHALTDRGANRQLDRAIGKLRLASAAHRAGIGSVTGTSPAEPAETCGGPLTVAQAADLLGITSRGVIKAMTPAPDPLTPGQQLTPPQSAG